MNPVEPSAMIRQRASELRQLYVALVEKGFEPAQALVLIGYHVLAAYGKKE